MDLSRDSSGLALLICAGLLLLSVAATALVVAACVVGKRADERRAGVSPPPRPRS